MRLRFYRFAGAFYSTEIPFRGLLLIPRDFATNISPKTEDCARGGNSPSGFILKFSVVNGDRASNCKFQAVAGSAASFRAASSSAYMRSLFSQIGTSGGARVSKYADTYVFCAVLGVLLSDGGAAREVAVVRNAFRADTL